MPPDNVTRDKMTMDVQKMDRSTPDLSEARPPEKPAELKTAKRSFDVAFLMMPDERMKQKQLRVSRQIFADAASDNFRRNHEYLTRPGRDELKGTDLSTTACYNSEKFRQNNNNSPPAGAELNIDVGTDEFATKSVLSDSDVSDMSRSRPNSTESFSRPARVVHESPYRNKIFDDPSLIPQARSHYEQDKFMMSRFSDVNPRSAFTKVTNSYQNNTAAPTASPGHSESPDNLSYQNSMSPPLNTASPPALNNLFSKSPPFKSLIPANHPFLSSSHAFFKNQGLQTYQNQFAENQHNSEQFIKTTQPNYSEKNENEKQLHFSQSNSKFGHLLPFRPEMSPYLQSGASPYNFPMQNFHHSNPELLKFQHQGEAINPLIRNPAAAILSTLLPPTLATLSLPAQNVCAKCNISFRMTSDLVYHMRSHHKSEVNYDATRRKREDKLKCPVCAESFRERHHLTRHMTAHQDKEGDILDHQIDVPEVGNSNYCPKPKNRPYYGHSNGLHQK